jgi:hypothetical protein
MFYKNIKLKQFEMKWKKGKAIPVTGCGDPYGCETLWLPDS